MLSVFSAASIMAVPRGREGGQECGEEWVSVSFLPHVVIHEEQLISLLIGLLFVSSSFLLRGSLLTLGFAQLISKEAPHIPFLGHIVQSPYLNRCFVLGVRGEKVG